MQKKFSTIFVQYKHCFKHVKIAHKKYTLVETCVCGIAQKILVCWHASASSELLTLMLRCWSVAAVKNSVRRLQVE